MSTDMIPSEGGNVPSFMQGTYEDTGLQLLSQYAQPPRMKLRQPTARPPLSDAAAEGSVVLMPSMQIVASKEEAFYVVPVFFYPEWCVFNPLSMNDLPTIRERTLDPDSEIAARSRNPDTRHAPVPGHEADFNADGKKRKRLEYREHLNFIFELVGGDLNGVEFVATFAKGEHRTGRMLASSIQMRARSSNVNAYGLVFEAKCKQRSNDSGVWYGLDFTIPTDGHSAFVETAEHYKRLKAAHEAHLSMYEKAVAGLADFINPDEETTEPSAESSEF